MTPAQFDKWRPRTAAAFGLEDWARKKGLEVLDADDKPNLRTGDILTFDTSHTGFVADDAKGVIQTIEGNTGASGGRDGDGVWDKSRNFKESRKFIRLLQP
jgi:cell wall-associated NlpC family hydrolase